MPTATATANTKPVKPTGVLAALLIFAIVLFAAPPNTRLVLAGAVIVIALLYKGGDAANIINQLRQRIYG